MWSLAHTLELVRPALPPAIAPPALLARVDEVARRLPAQLTRRFYLERWLGDAAPRLDLIVRVDACGRSVLAALDEGGWDEELAAHAAWRRLASFAREWERPGSGLERGVEALWLEFDLPAAAAAGQTPVPRVFCDFTREMREHPSREARLDLLQCALRPLLPAGLEAEAVGGLRACLQQLPPDASIPYVGAVLGERGPLLRVCAQGLQRDLVRYLRAVGWAGDGDDVERSVLALDDVSVVHLDVASAVAPRIGLEYAFARASQARGRVQETERLDELVARGWCAAGVRDELLRWPGTSVESLPHEIWLTRLTRRLNHVKLTYATGQPVGLKAYLCIQHDLVAAGTLIGDRFWVPPAAGPHPSAIG